MYSSKGFPGISVVKNPPASAVSIPGWERSSGVGNGNPLQYSCLGNPMDRRAWRATVSPQGNKCVGHNLATREQQQYSS